MRKFKRFWFGRVALGWLGRAGCQARRVALALAGAALFCAFSAQAANICYSKTKTCGGGGPPCDQSCYDNVKAECLPPVEFKFQLGGGQLTNAQMCERFGTPVSRVKPRLWSGGTYQDFEYGQIASYKQLANGTPVNGLVLRASRSPQAGANGLYAATADWSSMAPYSYDMFFVRVVVDDENSGPTQYDAGGGSANRWDSGLKPNAYFIIIEGCNLDLTGAHECNEHWSHPVFLDVLSELYTSYVIALPGQLVILEHPTPLPAEPAPQSGTAFLDVPDPVRLTASETTALLRAFCDRSLLETVDGHENEIRDDVLVAWLRLAELHLPCSGFANTQAFKDRISADLKNAKVVSVVGTDFGIAEASALRIALGQPSLLGPSAHKHGDYDMRFDGLLRAYYRFGSLLSAESLTTIADKLLTMRGGADQHREFAYVDGVVATPFRETENHIWMIESARYLTNNLLAQRLKTSGQPVPRDYDNDKNGMATWMLARLQDVLVKDLYEFNSRPYDRLTYSALVSLADFAAAYDGPCVMAPAGGPPPPSSCEVTWGARNALDFLSAKFAASSNELRRAAPFRRQPVFKAYPRMWTSGGDDLTWRHFAYIGGSATFAHDRYLRLAVNVEGPLFLADLSRYRPPVLITDLLRFPDGSGPYFQQFHSTARGTNAVEVYYRSPRFLISAGGRFETGTGIPNDLAAVLDAASGGLTHTADGESAWALPTTLMPTAEGGDYNDFIRIAGSADERGRNNTCVAPGFACGMNPRIPPGLPEDCQERVGPWTFINFNKDTPECPYKYGFYAVVYSKTCGGAADCEGAAGSDSGTFGFFEAVPSNFDYPAFKNGVLAGNENRRFAYRGKNTYQSPLSGTTVFTYDQGMDTWAIVSNDNADTAINPERSLERWPVAAGGLVSTPKRACIVVDNARLNQRLILDGTDVSHPRRAIVKRSSRECGCPLIDACLNPRVG